MDFRKIFFGFVLLIFGNWGIGQVDSNSTIIQVEDTSGTENYYIENFNASTVIHSNVLDSLYTVNVSFAIKDSAEVGNVHIEIALVQQEELVVINSSNYTISQIEEHYMDQAPFVMIAAGDVVGNNVYKVTIMISSLDGMTDRVLTKIISI